MGERLKEGDLVCITAIGKIDRVYSNCYMVRVHSERVLMSHSDVALVTEQESPVIFTLFQDYHTKLYRAQWLLPWDTEPQWFHMHGLLDPERVKLDVLKVSPRAVYMDNEAFQAAVQQRGITKAI